MAIETGSEGENIDTDMLIIKERLEHVEQHQRVLAYDVGVLQGQRARRQELLDKTELLLAGILVGMLIAGFILLD